MTGGASVLHVAFESQFQCILNHSMVFKFSNSACGRTRGIWLRSILAHERNKDVISAKIVIENIQNPHTVFSASGYDQMANQNSRLQYALLVELGFSCL